MSGTELAIVFSMALVLVMATGVFAQTVVTDTSTSSDTWSNSAPASDFVESFILNGDFQSWTGDTGMPDHWTSWRSNPSGWINSRLHEVDMTVPWDATGQSNAMGWFIQHNGATHGPAYAGAYQHLTEIPAAGYYFVNASVTAYWVRDTGPYNSVAWYAVSDSSNPGEVEHWRELYADLFVCANAGNCTYAGRNETVWIEPGQYFHLRVAQKFPVLFSGTFFILDDVSIVRAGDETQMEAFDDPNGFYQWVKRSGHDDYTWHMGQESLPSDYTSHVIVRWSPHAPR